MNAENDKNAFFFFAGKKETKFFIVPQQACWVIQWIFQGLKKYVVDFVTSMFTAVAVKRSEFVCSYLRQKSG